MKIDRNKIKLCLAQNCMNMADLVEQSGMPYGTVKGALQGRGIRPATMGKIAKALGVKVEEIAVIEPQE